MRLGFGWLGASVRSASLKHDPRRKVDVMVSGGAALTTGAVWPLAVAPDFDVTVSLGLVAVADTEKTHSRWRLRERHRAGLPAEYAFLATGRLSGTVSVA